MNTKAKQKLLLAAAVVTVLNFTGCGKYEDGPAFSLRTKTSRLTGEWKVVEIAHVAPENDQVVILEFEKDGDFKVTATYDNYSYSASGEWEWTHGKESVEITYKDGNDSETIEWDIKRLTNDELWFEDEDKEKVKCEKE